MNGPDFPRDPPPEYSPEVTALLAALAKEKGGFGLDRMLRGAFRALKDEENPESFVHCAQSARELMEKFEHAKHGLGKAELRDEHRENFKDRTDRHAKVWQTTKDRSKAYKKGKWRGKIDEPVEAFLTETDDFFEWFANHDLYRKNKVEAIVLRLDPMFSALSQVDQERIAREWVDLRGFFTQVAHHHDFGLTRAAMDDALARLVRYLHRRLAPVDAANKEAIRAHIREWEKRGVTDEALPPKGLLESGADNAFFFANLQSADWVRVLDRAGYFKSPPEPFSTEGAEWHPVWPQSRYLIGAASKSGAEVATAMAGIPVTENLNVNEDLFRAAVQLPAEHAPKVVKRVRPWIKTANIRLHSRNLAKFVQHLASHKIGTALGVLEDAISFAPGEWPEGEKPKKKSMFDWEPEPVARFDSYEYNEVLTAAIPTLVKAKALVTVGSLSKVLDGYIEARGRKDRRRGYDGSLYWRPSIEDSCQNSLYEEVTSLISTLRDIGDGELKANRVSLSALLAVTAKFAPDIFRRLEMHWMRTGVAQATPAQLRDYLLKELHFRSGRFEREYGLLLQAGFTKLAKKEQAKILGWIAKGPDLPKGARGKDARAWADGWRVQKFYWIKDSLPPALRRRYDGWAAKGLEPEHPGFASWTGEFEEVTCQSPVGVDAFRALSVPEQIAYLKTWQPAGDKWNGPSRSGLAGVLHTLVTEAPEKFLEHAALFRELEPEYVGTFLSALWEKLKDGTTHALAEVWTLADWLLAQPDEEVDLFDEFIRQTRRGRRWYSARLALARLLHSLLRSTAHPLPVGDRDRIWSLLAKLARDPDPSATAQAEGGDDEGHMGPYTNSLNTIRGEAFHAIFEYVAWVHRVIPEHKGLPAEVRELLEAHLDPAVEPTLTVRSIYASSLNRFGAWDMAWLTLNHSRIFPRETHPKLNAVAWATFITHAQPSLEVFRLLKDEFAFAINNMAPPAGKPRSDPRVFLGRYLMILYWGGHLEITRSEDLMTDYFARAPDSARAGVMDFIGHALKRSVGPVDEKILARLRSFWEWRREIARKASPNHREELGGFAWWFESAKFDQHWAAGQMLESLSFSGRFENQFLWMKRFAGMTDKEPAMAVRALELTVENTRAAGAHFWSDEEALAILMAGLKSDDPDIRARAERLRDGFLREGKSQFLDLR